MGCQGWALPRDRSQQALATLKVNLPLRCDPKEPKVPSSPQPGTWCQHSFSCPSGLGAKSLFLPAGSGLAPRVPHSAAGQHCSHALLHLREGMKSSLSPCLSLPAHLTAGVPGAGSASLPSHHPVPSVSQRGADGLSQGGAGSRTNEDMRRRLFPPWQHLHLHEGGAETPAAWLLMCPEHTGARGAESQAQAGTGESSSGYDPRQVCSHPPGGTFSPLPCPAT